MKYLAAVANGDEVTNVYITEVKKVIIEEGIYILYDVEGAVLFSSPSDSLVYLELI